MKQITLGIVGGGQLGRMICESAKKLRIKTLVLDPTPKSPAAQVANAQIIGDFKDGRKIRALAKKVDFLTFEIESANVKALKKLTQEGVKIQPHVQTLEIIQDKLTQKQFLLANNLPCPEFNQVQSIKDIKKTAGYLGYPLVLKARFHGYDGRGNAVINSEGDIKSTFEKLRGKLYIEKFILFKRELAIQIVKGINGQVKLYPVVETIQENNICHVVKAPAKISNKIKNQTQKLAKEIAKVLKGAGVFGVEMFLTKDDKLLINEVAPRVHNSGHYTIEACKTSQFEQHVRAVCGLSLGSTQMIVPAAVMINILGDRNTRANPKGIEKAKKINGVYVHIYGKFETRIERKMGHITVIGKTVEGCLTKARKIRLGVSI